MVIFVYIVPISMAVNFRMLRDTSHLIRGWCAVVVLPNGPFNTIIVTPIDIEVQESITNIILVESCVFYQISLDGNFRQDSFSTQRAVQGIFYNPIWKVVASCRGDVRQSVRRLYRVSSTWLDISILQYTFSSWHDMWGSSFITIRSFQPTLQPEVYQIFLNHGLINQDKWLKFVTWVARCMFLDIEFNSCKNHIFGFLTIILTHFGFLEVFRIF